jgi:transcriptional regulator with XRE-family HTH domain
MPLNVRLNEIIRGLRQAYFVKQDPFAAALGRSVAEVSLWESGERRPSEGSLTRMLRELRVAGATTPELNALVGAWRRGMPTESWDVLISSAAGDVPLYCPAGPRRRVR